MHYLVVLYVNVSQLNFCQASWYFCQQIAWEIALYSKSLGWILTGPLFSKAGGNLWITLFIFVVYSAIHLKSVSSLSSEAFLLALRCFISRRGRLTTIYFDSGTNFKGAFNEPSKLDWDKILRETVISKTSWKYMPPNVAWNERRIMKELLICALGKSILNYEELNTFLCDLELVIKCRPLTYISEKHPE